MLFTDIEGSTRLLQELGRDRYAEALDLHRRLLRESFERHDGYEVDYEGDAFFVAFARAEAAVAAASEAQIALAGADWPEGEVLRVRMGIHTGEPLPVPPKYVGMDVHRAARIMAAGHGGQVLVSQSTVGLLDASFPLRDLGEHRLKDLLRAERLHQIGDGEFPPLKSLGQTNLPVAAWPLVGRERELAQIEAQFGGGRRSRDVSRRTRPTRLGRTSARRSRRSGRTSSARTHGGADLWRWPEADIHFRRTWNGSCRSRSAPRSA
jgi:Adenylate and Guanylate cyclase catalytic domain